MNETLFYNIKPDSETKEAVDEISLYESAKNEYKALTDLMLDKSFPL